MLINPVVHLHLPEDNLAYELGVIVWDDACVAKSVDEPLGAGVVAVKQLAPVARNNDSTTASRVMAFSLIRSCRFIANRAFSDGTGW